MVLITNEDKKDIGYKFITGSNAERTFFTIDKNGKERKFIITINDEKGITSCKFVEEEIDDDDDGFMTAAIVAAAG